MATFPRLPSFWDYRVPCVLLQHLLSLRHVETGLGSISDGFGVEGNVGSTGLLRLLGHFPVLSLSFKGTPVSGRSSLMAPPWLSLAAE